MTADQQQSLMQQQHFSGIPAAQPKMRSDQLEVGKVFVGGLSRETTTNGLRGYFERFGDISDCVVMKDRSTGAPRGFGFVTYVSQITADRVVMHRHVIDGKEVEAKPAVPRDSEVLVRPLPPLPTAGPLPVLPGPTARPREVPVPPSTAMANDLGSKKIFVGGLSHETSESDFVSYFGAFGQVVDCVIMCDPHTRKPRGFGFITYDSIESVDRVCMSKFHELNGKRVEVKRAIPQDRMLATEDGTGVPGDEAFYGTFGHFPQYGSGGRGGFYAGPYLRGPGVAGMKGRGGGHQQMRNTQNGSQMQPWMNPNNPPSAGSSTCKACAGTEQTTSEVALNAALSTANSVLQGNSAEPQHGPSSTPEDAAINQELGSAFMNLGGNFSSATTALNQGLRTTYGLGSGEAASAPAAAMPPGGQGAPANKGGQSPQAGASAELTELTPQLLQEQLTHLAQQQKLLQQLQQQQLQLQLAQQHQTQQQLQLHMLQQQQQNPSGSGEQATEQSGDGADAQTSPTLQPQEASASAPAELAQEQTHIKQSKQPLPPATDASPATGDEGNG